MGIFGNRLEKKTIRNYIDDSTILVRDHLITGGQKLSAIQKMVEDVRKHEDMKKSGEEFYVRKTGELLEDYSYEITMAKETFKKLAEYKQQKEKFVSGKQKNNLIILAKEFKRLEQEFIRIYSYSLVAVQVEEELKEQFRANFVKTIKALNVPIHTDEKEDETSVGDNTTSDEV